MGFYNVAKPPGVTSHDVVDQLRRLVGRQVRTGHCGTLDPFASGVLVLCAGHATRLAQYVQDKPKRYLAEVTLGATSATDDPQGPISPSAAAAPSSRAVAEAVAQFVGRIQQVPPAHSAVHVDGKRAYNLARRGVEFTLSAREVMVHSIEIMRYEFPVLQIDVRCGGGTYIRSLARDIGRVLAVGGYCSSLARTAIGAFALAEAVAMENLDPAKDLISPLAALEDMAKVTLDAERVVKFCMGQAVQLDPDQAAALNGSGGPDSPQRSDELAVLDEQGLLIALGRREGDEGRIRPASVFRA